MKKDQVRPPPFFTRRRAGASPTPHRAQRCKSCESKNLRDFGREIAHRAVTRRPPISLYTAVPRTGCYTYDVGVWDFSIVQRPFSVAPCQTLALRFATFASLYGGGAGVSARLSPVRDSEHGSARGIFVRGLRGRVAGERKRGSDKAKKVVGFHR